MANAGRGGACGRRESKEESWPISRVLSGAIIHLGRTSPYASSNLPGSPCGPHVQPKLHAPLFGLAPSGVCRAVPVTSHAVRSYRTLSPLPLHPASSASERARMQIGGLLSVALSVGSRPPGVTWHSALWSPDFPLPSRDRDCSDCLANSRRAWWALGANNSSGSRG